MKFLILVYSALAVASATWEPVHEKYHGPLHYPKIHKGVPIEPAAVQHAREAHLMALFQASHGHGYSHDDHHEDEHKWHGPQHYPVIHKGVPVEPAEVQHAREAHLETVSYASHNNHDYDGFEHYGNHEEEHKWNGPLHYPKIYKGVPVEPFEVQHARAEHLKAFSGIHHHNDYNQVHHHVVHHYETPKIGHDGKPLDTIEVEAAKSKHLAAVHAALARNSHGHAHHYRKRRGAESYAHFSSIVDHVVPVYYHHHENSHHDSGDDEYQYDGHQYAYNHIHGDYEAEDDNSLINGNGHHDNSYGYSYEQIHAPVYGHHDVYNHHDHQIPAIGHDGTPLDTPEVQHAKAAHLAAHAAANSKHY